MDELLRLAAAVAAVQLLFAAWREWYAARRIVAVGGLDAETYAQYNCIPLQFAGSHHLIVRGAVAVTGFFTVRPKTRKQVFAARQIIGISEGSEEEYRDIRPRDRLQVLLDDGEHTAVFDRSIRRGVVSFYRTVAIRELGHPDFSENAHCVTVRTRGYLLPAADDTNSQWIEYEVTSGAPRSNRRNGPCSLEDIPEDAIEIIIVPGTVHQRTERTENGKSDGAVRRWLMRYNPNPIMGLTHVTASYGVPMATLIGLGVRSQGWAWAWETLRAITVLIGAFVFARVLMAALWRYVGNGAAQRSESPNQRIPLHLAHPSPPRRWTGSTARSLSVGRISNSTDLRSITAHAWRQLTYGILPLRR